MYLLACELYLKNKASDTDIGKTVVPIKKVFVKVVDGTVSVNLDSKLLENYGAILDENNHQTRFQKSLSMPPNNLSTVSLPNRATGANSKKPYVEFYGKYEKSKLTLSISVGTKTRKKTYEYAHHFENSKDPAISTPFDSLL